MVLADFAILVALADLAAVACLPWPWRPCRRRSAAFAVLAALAALRPPWPPSPPCAGLACLGRLGRLGRSVVLVALRGLGRSSPALVGSWPTLLRLGRLGASCGIGLGRLPSDRPTSADVSALADLVRRPPWSLGPAGACPNPTDPVDRSARRSARSGAGLGSPASTWLVTDRLLGPRTGVRGVKIHPTPGHRLPADQPTLARRATGARRGTPGRSRSTAPGRPTLSAIRRMKPSPAPDRPGRGDDQLAVGDSLVERRRVPRGRSGGRRRRRPRRSRLWRWNLGTLEKCRMASSSWARLGRVRPSVAMLDPSTTIRRRSGRSCSISYHSQPSDPGCSDHAHRCREGPPGRSARGLRHRSRAHRRRPNRRPRMRASDR